MLVFFRNFSVKRATNLAKLWLSFHLSRYFKRPVHWGMPLSVSVEPTTSCNLRCPECPSGLRKFSRPTGMLDLKLYQTLIDELAPNLWYLTLYFQGEPFLHAKLTELVAYASAKGIYTATSTNAHFLSYVKAEQIVRSGLDKLIVSVDGVDQDTYQSYRRGGSLSSALEGAAHVIDWKKRLSSSTPLVVFQFLVVRHNQHQIEAIKKLAKEMGANKVVFKTAQVYDYENGNELIPTIDRYSRYKALGGGKFALKNDLRNRCWRMWSGSVITWDGKVVPCCFDKDAQHVMGQVQQSGFAHVWHHAKYKHFRGALLRSRKEIDICRNCTEGMKVKVMQE